VVTWALVIHDLRRHLSAFKGMQENLRYYNHPAAPESGAGDSENQTDPAAQDLTRTRASRTATRRSCGRDLGRAAASQGIETGRETVPVSSTSEDSS
jgi:hypothetical protein